MISVTGWNGITFVDNRIYKSVFAPPFAANEYGRQQMPPIQSEWDNVARKTYLKRAISNLERNDGEEYEPTFVNNSELCLRVSL
jgi:hypothetical protein